MKKLGGILITTCFLLLTIAAQNSRTQHIQTLSDTPFNFPSDVIQDTRGYIWFGSIYGLYRYDGYEFVEFKNDPADTTSLSFNDVTQVYEDTRGSLWIATWGGGLNQYIPEENKFYRYRFAGNLEDIIWTVTETGEGKILVSSQDEGLWEIDPLTGGKAHIELENEPSSYIRALKKAGSNIFAGTPNGLYVIKNSLSQQIDLPVENTNPLFVSAIKQGADGNIWAATGAGLFELDTDGNLLHHYKGDFPEGNRVNDILFDNSKVIAATNAGLRAVNNAGNKLIPITKFGRELAEKAVAKIMKDKSGNYWFSTPSKGVVKAEPNIPPIENIALSDIPEGDITSVRQIDNNLWLGISGYGIARIANFGTANQTIAKTALENRNIGINTTLKYDDAVIIGTNKGIAVLNSVTLKPVHKSHKLSEIGKVWITVKQIKRYRDKLYFATWGRGIYIFDLNTHNFYASVITDEPNQEKLNFVNDIFFEDEDSYWLSTLGGLAHVQGNTTRVFNSNNSALSHSYVYDILPAPDDKLWLATADGLNLFDFQDSSFTSYHEKDGLPSSVILSLSYDENNNLWVGTNNGIAYWNGNSFVTLPQTGKTKFNSLQNGSGLIAASSHGLKKIHTDTVFKRNDIKPVITQLFYEDDKGSIHRELFTDDKIELLHNRNKFTIHFSNLNYSSGTANYHYLLKEVDNTWQSSNGSNSASYKFLSPGTYTFKVASGNVDETPHHASLTITITPPFYQTWWFVTLCVIFVGVLVYTFYQIRLRYKVKHALRIEKIKEEEAEKVRRKTAADFHDELGHKLTRISLLSKTIAAKLKNSIPDISTIADKIAKNSDELYDDTKDFIWSLKKEHDSVYELLLRLKDFGDELYGDTDISFNTTEIPEPFKHYHLNMETRRQIAMIFKEAMNNSLKHSGCTTVSLNTNLIDGKFELVLNDDGKGFDMQKARLGNGLRNMSERSVNIHGKLEINSVPEKGTMVKFLAPAAD